MATDHAAPGIPGPTAFVSPVVVVCEDTPGRNPIVGLEFDATLAPDTLSVDFTFTRANTTKGHPARLQIPPDDIAFFTRVVHKPLAQGDDDPHLLLVRPHFEPEKTLGCLQFRLYSRAPTVNRPSSNDKGDDNGGGGGDDDDDLRALAVASAFSVYFVHDDMRWATYRVLCLALRVLYNDKISPPELGDDEVFIDLDSPSPVPDPVSRLVSGGLTALAARLVYQKQQIHQLVVENIQARARLATLELRFERLEASLPNEGMVREVVDELPGGLDERVEELGEKYVAVEEEEVPGLASRHDSLDENHIRLEHEVQALRDADREDRVNVEAIVEESRARVQADRWGRVRNFFRAG